MTEHRQPKEALFTCSNTACKRNFAKPLKALDFQVSSGEIYEACPYCLSKLSTKHENTEVPLNEQNYDPSETKNSCDHYVGYLHERPQKNQIPDECIMCKRLISCMLDDLTK